MKNINKYFKILKIKIIYNVKNIIDNKKFELYNFNIRYKNIY